jgi:multimeric flavodoxin WrbA
MPKKIIGLSCGRKNGFGESYLRAAASGAKEAGVETEIIRAMDLKVLPCKGCWGCMKLGKCVLKDDVDWILDRTCRDDCALIVAVPCYHIRTNSFLTIINERLNHVFTHHPEILDKTRVGGIIGVGGSGYDGWASLNLPLANIFLQHTRVLVDQMQINHCRLKEWNLWMQEGSPLTSNTHKARIQDNDYDTIWKLWKEGNDALEFRQKAYLRAKKLGRNVAEAMSLPINKVEYLGEQSAVSCPVCHSNIILVPENLPYIMCPVCAVRGTVEVKDNVFKVKWNKKDAASPRFSREAVDHHFAWLGKNGEVANAQQPKIQALFDSFTDYGTVIKPNA